MRFIATIVGLVILLLLVEKITNKLFSVEKKRISETPGNRMNRWGQAILFLIFLITLWFMVDSSDIQRMTYFIIYLALLFGYQTIMEFMFIKESRQYISTAILLIIVLVIMYNLENYPFLVGG